MSCKSDSHMSLIYCYDRTLFLEKQEVTSGFSQQGRTGTKIRPWQFVPDRPTITPTGLFLCSSSSLKTLRAAVGSILGSYLVKIFIIPFHIQSNYSGAVQWSAGIITEFTISVIFFSLTMNMVAKSAEVERTGPLTKPYRHDNVGPREMLDPAKT